MPPKKSISEEQIINKAYEMVRNAGFQSLTTRALAKELNCSTQPIYQSFKDMNELKNILAKKALGYMLEFMKKNSTPEASPALVMILGYVEFAIEEGYLYELIYTSDVFTLNNAKDLVSSYEEVDLNLVIYAHGIIMMKKFGTLQLECEQLREMIIQAYECFQQKK